MRVRMFSVFFFFISYIDLKVKSENRKAAVYVLCCSIAPDCLHVFTGRLISEKEIKQFLWRASRFCVMEEIYGSWSIWGFLILFGRPFHSLFSYLFYRCSVSDGFLVSAQFFSVLMNTSHDHTSARYSIPNSCGGRVGHRMQMLILP